uniref:UPF0481 protein At3g47200-like n=1 Tax=Erigeron canadensis TaxID=72917 RepID=UPI001CB8EA31|nr:UPF0481 protein At3g47200-like [Erigeron canadensis]
MSGKGGQNVDNKVVEVKNSVVSDVVEAHHDVSKDVEVRGDDRHIERLISDLEKELESAWPQQQTSSKQQIVKVPRSMSANKDDDIYYKPKVVSIGPYHYGKDELKQIQDLKLDFARDLFFRDGMNKLKELYKNLHDASLLKKLKDYYDPKSFEHRFDDQAFGDMMFLDGCFIMYYILLSCGRHPFETKGTLLNHQMMSIRQDLFLLENQIPFTVIEMVKNHLSSKQDCEKDIERFIDQSTFSSPTATKPPADPACEVYHLLHLLQLSLTKDCKADAPPKNSSSASADHHDSMNKDAAKSNTSSSSSNILSAAHQIQPPQQSLPKVKELMNAGIHFKANRTTLLCQIGFSRHWYHMFSRATVRLPPVIMEAFTKYLFLNLMAYEASSHKPNEMWVTSYIYLLNSLINKSEDVKALRDAGVFADSEGSDDDIRNLIKDIAAAGGADHSAYLDVKNKITSFHNRFKSFNQSISEFNDKYFNSPWSFLALVGAVLALFLTAVQTYLAMKGECDDLCKFLKVNHHL